MTAAEIKRSIFKEIDALPESALLEMQEVLRRYAPRQQPTQPKKTRLLGSMKGLVLHMAPDFNAPLEDFKEYMPE